MHLYSIIETVLHIFYEAILKKSVYSYSLKTKGLKIGKKPHLGREATVLSSAFGARAGATWLRNVPPWPRL